MTAAAPSTAASVVLIHATDVGDATLARAVALLEAAQLTAAVGSPEVGNGEAATLRVHLMAGREPFRIRRTRGVLDVFLPENQLGAFEVIDEAERILFTVPDEHRRMLGRLVRCMMPAEATVLVVVRLRTRLCALHLREALLCARRRFESYGRVVFFAPDAPDSLGDLVSAGDIVRRASEIDPAALTGVLFFETVENVYFGTTPYTMMLDLPGVVERGCPLYGLFMDHSEIRLRQVRATGKQEFVTSYGDFAFFDQRSQPQIAAHHVARQPLLTGKPLNRFAYGRLTIHSTEHGPIDSFGFRIGGDLQELADRDADTIVIGLYGGSGAFCWRCHHDDTFGAMLERDLNCWSAERRRGLTFRVLNFGQLGYTILEEMQAWMMHGNRVRPDVVIAHSGFNDLFLAPLIDQTLVEKHDLIYNFNFDEVPFKPGSGKIDPARGARVVAAYMRRVEQFARLATGSGARFLYGRQPIWIDKALSAEEQAAMAQWLGVFTKNQPLYQQAALNMGFLYQRLEQELAGLPGRLEDASRPVAQTVAVVDCHRPCAAQGADRSLFLDVAHLTGAGNRIVADAYLDTLTGWFGDH